MPDTIAQSDRRLIDAALARGKCSVIPRGVSAIDVTAPMTPYIWHGGNRRQAIDPEVASRRSRVRDLHERGHSTDHIAMLCGVDPRTIRKDVAALREDGRLARGRRR